MEKIIINKLNKEFKIGAEKKQSILGCVLSFISDADFGKKAKVLKDISFSVDQKEILGIIGANGSGKSTLLRIIAGIYSADSGSVKVNGSVAYLSGFGQGLKPRLTMKDNILLIGSLMGLSQKEIRQKMAEIIDFSGLNEYIDTKIYKFSSGMVARLNFSIGIFCLMHKMPNILLLDEVFGTGADMNFEEKTIKKMEELITGGATVILVSHNLNLIKKYCNRVILLDKGEIIKIGSPEEAVAEYINLKRNSNAKN